MKIEVGADLPDGRRVRALERVVVRLENRHGHARYDGALSFADPRGVAGADWGRLMARWRVKPR